MDFPVLATALDQLTRVAAAVTDDQLDAPTPCGDWTVAQVLYHAAGDQHAWASFVGAGALPTYDPFSPPHRLETGVEETVGSAVAAAFSAWATVDPASESVPTPLPPLPAAPAPLAAAACALDAAVHAWDLAVATGQPSPLTDELAVQLLPAARLIAEPLRGFAFAAALPEADGADATGTLLRYLGRDPRWAR
jgi:uncharacterized protein (TIGR03086 family)